MTVNESTHHYQVTPKISGHVSKTVYAQEDIYSNVSGLCSPKSIALKAQNSFSLSGQDYEENVLLPAKNPKRMSAKEAALKLSSSIIQDFSSGPLFAFETILKSHKHESIMVAMIGHDRENFSGSWTPKEHALAKHLIEKFAEKRLPIVSFIDTPGADASEEANLNVQAKSISELITSMTNAPVPTLGVIWGLAYSGGAIPLAATNLLYAIDGALFSTIQPEGLASIARKQRLTWQNCAQQVSISASESYTKGWIDGVIELDLEDKAHDFTTLAQTFIESLIYIEYLAKSDFRSNQKTGLENWHKWVKRETDRSKNVSLDKRSLKSDITSLPSPLEFCIRSSRHQQICSRLSYSELSDKLVSDQEIRQVKEQQSSYKNLSLIERWQQNPESIRYLSNLEKSFDRLIKSYQQRGHQRGTLGALILGDSEKNYTKSLRHLALDLGFYTYAKWKSVSPACLSELITHLDAECYQEQSHSLSDSSALKSINTYDLFHIQEIKYELQYVLRRLRTFDLLYDGLIDNLGLVAHEANQHHQISFAAMEKLVLSAINERLETDYQTFWKDLLELIDSRDIAPFLNQVAEIKQRLNPRIAESLFVLINYLITSLIPEYLKQLEHPTESKYKGKIVPTRIGRRKDFWHRLFVAQCDLQIVELQNQVKALKISPQAWIEKLFSEYQTLNDHWVSADHCHFPGFRQSIAEHARSSCAAGMITGLGTLRESETRVGFVVSNTLFQAGAMDTASACKILDLINYCQTSELPIVFIISSGGMQTKEGAGSLFGMAAVNEAITQYKQSTDQSILMIGHGDCTGGAQASFMTHPLVNTWYVTGANIPFAGQLVVPSYLPSTSTLSNYLSQTKDLMQGLVCHPFAPNLDEQLTQIDPSIPVATIEMNDLIAKVLQSKDHAQQGSESTSTPQEIDKEFGPIQKVLVHARGCTASKVVSDLKQNGKQVVLLQSDPDMKSHAASLLESQDELICLGGNTPEESYLNANSVLRLARIWEVDAIHPGIGFLSENPDFAKACQRQRLNFIGPDYRSIMAMGDKSAAIQCAIDAGVPVVPGSYKSIENEEELHSCALDVGFPILLKAAFGGGGKGIERLNKMDELAEAFQRLSLEAYSAFGKGDLYIERFVEAIRHIEVQVARDRFGHTKLLGLRDCSVQRDNQKIVEESGSNALSETLKNQAFDYAQKLSAHINYVGIGTVEFIYNVDENCLYFMEMNTRLQVEHPVTEAVSSLSLVELQLNIAEGKSIENLRWQNKGHALEVRINAEKVELNDSEFSIISSPGRVISLDYPTEPHLKIVQSIEQGQEVTPYYDSLILQVIVHGESRPDSIRKMLSFLELIEVGGINTNIALLQSILSDERFQKGQYTTSFIQDFKNRVDGKRINQAVIKNMVSEQDIKIHRSNELKVFSPSSGVVYSASSPGEKAYAEEGDIIQVEQTLCLIESMKMYRSFSLEQHNSQSACLYPNSNKYQIQKIFASDGQQVSEGDLLFVVEPIEQPS